MENSPKLRYLILRCKLEKIPLHSLTKAWSYQISQFYWTLELTNLPNLTSRLETSSCTADIKLDAHYLDIFSFRSIWKSQKSTCQCWIFTIWTFSAVSSSNSILNLETTRTTIHQRSYLHRYVNIAWALREKEPRKFVWQLFVFKINDCKLKFPNVQCRVWRILTTSTRNKICQHVEPCPLSNFQVVRLKVHLWREPMSLLLWAEVPGNVRKNSCTHMRWRGPTREI